MPESGNDTETETEAETETTEIQHVVNPVPNLNKTLETFHVRFAHAEIVSF